MSRRIDLRIYLCPALMDGLTFFVTFAIMFRAGRQGFSNAQCAALTGLPAIVYALASLTLGARLGRENAWCLAAAGAPLCGLLALGLMWAASFPLLLGLNLAFTAGVALFFNAFQTFMRGEAPPGGLTRSIAYYTLAWSAGSAFGFLASGSLFELGPAALSVLVVALAGGVLAILLRHEPRGLHERSADEHVEEGSAAARPVDPRYVWIGWLTIFAVCFIQRPVMTFFPALGAKAGLPSFLAGVPLFLHMGLQALAGFAMVRFRDVLYRRAPMLFLQGAAALVLLALWRWPGYALGLAGLSLLGVYAGFAYFTAVYYAGNSGRRSFNTGVNEFLVGLGGVAGVFACEWGMRRWGDGALYPVCAALAVATAVLQAALGTRRGASRP